MSLKSTRTCIRKNQQLRLVRGSDPKQSALFTITGVIGEGGSSVCYSAEHGGRMGRLKEFYPVDTALGDKNFFFFFRRSKQNQLVSVGEGMAERFEGMCREFTHAYEVLEQVKRENRHHELLNNYIPPYELFRGEPEEGQPGTVYVWTPNDKKGKNFQDYLTEVRKYPRKLPEHKLYNILTTLITVADCIRLFHGAGLLHLDIKPSNFLVPYDSQMNINPGSISLFDVNSIYALDSDFPRVSGTPGFRAPEAEIGRADNRSDIFSIGAMLYYAVVISDPQEPALYEQGQYPNLERLVEDSALIRASETNSSPSVKFLLTHILRKCLARRPKDRYDCCEALIGDLKTARAYLLPDIFGSQLKQDKRLAILDRASKAQTAPTAVLQNLLYTSPLYTNLGEEETKLRILVVGAGTYGQKFMDQCLQAGQMRGYELDICAASAEAELNKAVYLHYRPALTEFVNVDGSMKNSPFEPYARMRFVGTPDAFVRGKNAHNAALAKDILTREYPQSCHYIFVALGDDDLNYDVAKAFSDQKPGCPIHFVVQSGEHRVYRKASPVYVNDPITPASIDPELDAMAFSAHLSWLDGRTLDMQEAKKQFRDPYYYHSSVSYVLSIPYKLMSIGIRERDPALAAKEFQKRLLSGSERTRADLSRLTALEHRRWVMEKVTDGWTAPRDDSGEIDYEGCIRRCRINDKSRKLHPCIVHSGEDTPLSDPGYSWNAPCSADGDLDPLDRMSVELHRCALAHAEAFRRSQPLQGDDILALRKLAKGSEEADRAFRRYLHCLQNLLEGNKNYASLLDSYEQDLEAALRIAVPENRREVADRLGWIRKHFFPVIQSNSRRDYKSYDETLVRNIPYILTNRHQPYLALAFDDAQNQEGRNDIVFGNVASATVLHPAKITYLYYATPKTDISRFLGKAAAVLKYLHQRHLHCQVSFTIAHTGAEEAAARLKAGLQELRDTTRLQNFTVTPCADEGEAAEIFFQSLTGKRVDLFDGSTRLFRSQVQTGWFLGRLLERIPYFEFDREHQTFPVCRGCEYLSYIKGGACLRVEDMFLLMDARDNRFHHPEFADDYMTLWNIYTGANSKSPTAFRNGVTNWNRLCNQLDAFAQKNDAIADITLDPEKKGFDRHFIYFFPGYAFRAAEKLLTALKQTGAVTERSVLCTHASDTCRIDLYSGWNLGTVFENLFARPYMLIDPQNLKIVDLYRGNIRHIMISYENLVVNNLVLEDKYSYSVLEQLYKNHFIIKLKQSENNPQCVSFCYTSPRMKKMLTTAGEILEVYTYYELMKLGCFDDLASGYEFRWGSTDVVNEIDAIVTKGMRSVLVECKGRKQLDQGFYHKLTSLADQFGIGARKVLIANTYEQSAYLDGENQTQLQRGRQMGIITIYKPDEIRNIGRTLQSILEGTYQED